MDECVRILDKMPERNPTDGTFELTIRCNLHCKMCLFRHDDSENAEIKSKELSAGQWIDMARQTAEAGTMSLLITGGEPLLRPDFCQIWEGIYQYGFIITLYTNATLVTPKVMETLRKYPPHRIGVTIYGASPETYEKVTGSAAAYKKMLCGVRALKTLPSRLDYRMTVIQDNYDDVAYVEDLVNGFDSDAVLITTPLVTKAVRGACADAEMCRLPPGKDFSLTVDRTVRELKRRLGPRFDQGSLSFVRKDPLCTDRTACGTPTLFGCSAGMRSYTVSWDGMLLACQVMGSFSQAIGKSFADAWKRFPIGVKLPPVSEKCSVCPVGDYCSLCPAFRFAETGSFSAAPDYICATAERISEMINQSEIIKETT